MLIAGKLVEGNTTLDVINPANEEVFATVPRANQENVMTAIAAAKSAQQLWKNKKVNMLFMFCHSINETNKQ